MSLPLLAEIPEAWIIGFPIVVLIVQLVQAVFMFVMQTKTKKIDTLENDIRRVTEQAIETKLASLENRLSNPITVLQTRVQSIEQRLAAGDQHFKVADERSHRLEVSILEKLQELRDHMATKADLNRLREELKK